MPTANEASLHAIQRRIEAAVAARGGGSVRLLAVSKGKSAGDIRRLALLGQRAFGENYLQEANGKIEALAELAPEWHFIGRLQSNKAAEVAARFDWVQSVDRPRLVEALAIGRAGTRAPLNVLLQVNIDGEVGKGGCTPAELPALAQAVAGHGSLALRGLMAIPAPLQDPQARRRAFAALHALYRQLQAVHPGIDTLSMGMSADFEDAIAEGATMVRIGTALFGPRD